VPPVEDSFAKTRIAEAIAVMAKEYGPQGWWPVRSERRRFANPGGLLEQDGYHPGQFDLPRTRKGRWEICCGAVLTQNTAWINVRRALAALQARGLVTPERILLTPQGTLKAAIRPAGYFNQKSGYLCAMADWFIGNDRKLCQAVRSRASLETVRPELLAVRGVGPETADSILLYAYALPTFVVDAYTRRVFARLSWIEADRSYEHIRALLEAALAQRSAAATVRLWQEAHALIVEHAKRHHGRGADISQDFLLRLL
jgi:endonuclease III related protein